MGALAPAAYAAHAPATHGSTPKPAPHVLVPSLTPGRYVGQVTDTLRTPTHKLRLGTGHRAMGDLVFVDHVASHTAYRTCVRRRSPKLTTCFDAVSPADDVANVTPLRFGAGDYHVQWKVAGVVVAAWHFMVA